MKVEYKVLGDLAEVTFSHDCEEDLNKFKVFLKKHEVQNLIYDLEEFLEETSWNPKFEELSKIDKECKFKREDIEEMMEYGTISPFDGFGYWGTSDKISDFCIFNSPPVWATHGYWYNR